jgi:hypothetical protein
VVGRVNGRVEPSALRAGPISSIEPTQPLNSVESDVSTAVNSSITAATTDSDEDSDIEPKDARPLSDLFCDIVAKREIVPPSSPLLLSFVPATESLPPSPPKSLSRPVSSQPSPSYVCIPSSIPSFSPPSPHSAPPVGPQRALAPVLVASSQDERRVTGPDSPAAGAACDGHAADGEVEEKVEAPEADGGGSGSQADSDVQITGARIFTDAPAPIGTLTMPELAVLPHALRMMHTIGSGRCSIAAPMLSLGRLPRDHDDAKRKDRPRIHRRIDEERLDLGRSMSALWNEDRWIREVPVDMRMSRVNDAVNRHTSQTSYDILRRMLTDPQQRTAWMEPSVFYVAAEMYEVGIFVITWYAHSGQGAANYRHIRPASKKHIIVWFADGHFQAVQYEGKSTFGSSHCVVQHLRLLCVSHALEVVKEDDIDVQILVARLGVSLTHPAADAPEADEVLPAAALSGLLLRRTSRVIPVKANPPADSAAPHRLVPADCFKALARSPAKPPVSRSGSSKAKRATASSPTRVPSAASRLLGGRSALTAVPVAGAPLSPVDIAAHGPLYDHLSLHNVPHWVSMCTLPFNAYRLASERNDRAGQNQAVEDILMLPQRVLTRTSRGEGDRKRLNRTIRARCLLQREELRSRYNCQPPRERNVQLQQIGDTAPLVHRAAHAAAPEPAVQEDAIAVAQHTAATATVSEAALKEAAEEAPDAADDHEECSDEHDGDDYVRAFIRATDRDTADPDRKAAQRAQWHVRRGHLQQAARALHSTATMADLRQPHVQQAVAALHPALPDTSVIPPLPADAPQQILEDDKEMVSLLRRSDNGSASGPSGWGGNMLSSLAQSDLCRAGIIALLKDILNGNLPARARQLLLASRLVALTKMEGKYRPIAIGELFPRLAGKLAMSKVTSAAAALLAPHQLGVGVASGAERIVHSLQHTLSDKGRRHAMLKLDISNAFNSCDRARALRVLYEQPALGAMWRMADFAYATPSQLLLQGCEGQHLLSRNGVKQGDALSAVLFCLYLRDTLAEVNTLADVELHGFFDDINVAGEPAEVIKALHALQRLLPAIGLQLNTAKSHFAYFHDAEAPLHHDVLATLAERNITLHRDWLEVVGSVVGRDENAIRAGVTATLGSDDGTPALFQRLQLDELSVQSALLVLRQCGVPQMNYALRCTPPPCIRLAATAFDELVIGAAQNKLRLQHDEVEQRTTQHLLRAPLRHGGFGLASARQTSPAAYLGSVAAAASAPAFVPYRDPSCPLPANAQLHQWIAGSIAELVNAAPECEALLPPSPSVFFRHPTVLTTSSLQHELSLQATNSFYKASLQRATDAKKEDDGRARALLTSVSAPRAWTWKTVLPTSRALELTDTQYRLAARLNLGLPPVDGVDLGELPDNCPVCADVKNVPYRSIRDDPWHFLTCKKLSKGEISTRHDQVAEQVSRCAQLLGIRVRREATGLDEDTSLRPDLLLTLPGRTVLSDVVVCHPLAPGARNTSGTRKLCTAKDSERKKNKKYSRLSSRHRFVQLPIAIETTGGMGARTRTLVDAMADASAEQLVTWSRDSVIRELVGSMAMAVQRGNAMTFLEGYDRAMHVALAKHAASAKQRAVAEQEEDDRGVDTTEGESESEDEDGKAEDDGSGEEEEEEVAV